MKVQEGYLAQRRQQPFTPSPDSDHLEGSGRLGVDNEAGFTFRTCVPIHKLRSTRLLVALPLRPW
jgi:hypothetical protein